MRPPDVPAVADVVEEQIRRMMPIAETDGPKAVILQALETAILGALADQRKMLSDRLAAEARWLREMYESSKDGSQEKRDYMLRMLATEDAANSVRGDL